MIRPPPRSPLFPYTTLSRPPAAEPCLPPRSTPILTRRSSPGESPHPFDRGRATLRTSCPVQFEPQAAVAWRSRIGRVRPSLHPGSGPRAREAGVRDRIACRVAVRRQNRRPVRVNHCGVGAGGGTRTPTRFEPNGILSSRNGGEQETPSYVIHRNPVGSVVLADDEESNE